MKKLILTLTLVLTLLSVLQASDYMSDENGLTLVRVQPTPELNIDAFNLRGEHLRTAAQFQLISYGCIGISGLLITLESRGVIESNDSGVLMVATILGVSALGLQIASWIEINKAGKIVIHLNK